MRIYNRFPALVLLLGFAQTAAALDATKALTQDVHRIWGQEEGLFQPTVYSIVQTQDGFLWLGTQDSLIRFDGLHFREYDHAAEAGIQRSLIRSLLEDATGNLWVATIGNGLVRIAANGSFRRFGKADGMTSQNVFCLSKANDGSMFVCTDEGLLQYRDGRFRIFSVVDGLPTPNVRDTCQTEDGTQWVSGVDFGVGVLRGGKFQSFTGPGLAARERVGQLECDAGNVVWVGKPDGLVRIDHGKVRTFTTADGLPDNAVSSLYESPNGTLWIGTNDGITRYLNGHFNTYRTRDGLSHSLVLSTYIDREGTLWVGTKNGLDQFTDGKVTPYSTNEGMLSNNAGAVVEDAAGRLWVGTLDAGLNVFEGRKVRAITVRDGLLDDTVLSLYPEANGDLWVGTAKGLNCIRGDRVIRSLPGGGVNAIFRDNDGVLWLGTNKGLAYLYGSVIRMWRDERREVYALSGIRTVPLFFSSAGPSLSYLKGGVAHVADLQSYQPISCFYFDHEKRIGWLGSLGSGLLYWKNGQFTHIRVKDGLYDNRISAILRDDKSNFWLASSKGIFRVNEKELLDFVNGQIHYVTSIPFTTGQLRFECSSGVQPAATRTRDGRLWFSTTNGLVMIDPNRLQSNSEPPPVQLTSTIINGRRTEPHANITLNPFERNLEIRYAGLSFITPEKVTFRYMLEGYDKNWIDAGTRREAFYGNLPPNSYRFLVMARNVDGVWSKSAASLEFRVRPRLYEHKWFLPLAIVVLASAVAIWYRLRIRRLKQRFDWVLGERSRIARELHDTLLQGLSGVTMQLQALWVRLTPSRERDMLGDIIKDAARCSKEARQSLWGLRSTETRPANFSDKLAENCREANAGNRLQLGFRLEEVSLASMPDAEYQVLRIAREVVSNAVQHSGGTHMDIELRVSDSALRLTMKDDGIGFDTHPSVNGHFGIVGMQERAEEIGAQLDISGQPGQGVVVALCLPLGAEAAKNSRMNRPEHQLQ